MKKASVFLKLAILTFAVSGAKPSDAANYYVFSSHSIEIKNWNGTAYSFSSSSSDTSGYYYNSGTVTKGLTMWTINSSYSIEAVVPSTMKFLGWYTRKSGWASSGANPEWPKVDDCTDLLTTSTCLSSGEIESAGQRSGVPVVLAKYIPLRVISAEVLPVGAGFVSGTNTVEEGATVSLSVTSNDGYAFAGWTTNGVTVSTKTPYDFVASAETEGAYVANFTGRVYTVTFDPNGGGEPSPTTKIVSYGSAYGALASCEWADHSFAGWWTNKTGGVQILETNIVTTAQDHTVYARWTAAEFTVIYKDATQFPEKILKTETVAWGENTTPPDTPTHDGWTFDRWTGWDDFKEVKQDRTYTAMGHNNTYTVRYHACNGTEDKNDETFNCYESRNLSPSTFARDGYSFSGWDTDPAASTVVYKDQESVLNLAWSGMFHLYAVWEPNHYTVAFDPNGGEGSMASVQLVYGEPYIVPNATFKKSGSEFESWTVSGSPMLSACKPGDVVSNLTAVADGMVTFKAVWRGFYTIAFDAEGGSGTMEPVPVERGVDYVLPPCEFVQTGYAFGGWATNHEDALALKVSYADGATVKNLAETAETNVLHAVWETNSYVVVFNANAADASGSMPEQPFVYDQSQNLVSNAFVRSELWAFVCWSNAVTGVTYADGAEVTNLTSVADGRVELLAVWCSDVGELSAAMGCDNLKWVDGNWEGANKGWAVCADSVGGNVPPCVRHQGNLDSTMYARILSGGTLTFKWRPVEEGETLNLVVYRWDGQAYKADRNFEKTYATDAYSSWRDVDEFDLSDLVVDDSDHPPLLYIISQNIENWVCDSAIDDMIWTPVGDDPECAVEILSVAVSDGKFVLSFMSDERFDYNLLTNANLLIDSWGVMTNEVGTGEAITFEPEIVEGQPQLFYKVETVQKK